MYNRHLEERAALRKLLREADQGQQDAQDQLAHLIQVLIADCCLMSFNVLT